MSIAAAAIAFNSISQNLLEPSKACRHGIWAFANFKACFSLSPALSTFITATCLLYYPNTLELLRESLFPLRVQKYRLELFHAPLYLPLAAP